MSARMPFLTLGGAQPKSSATAGSGNTPSFIANAAHPLNRVSGQPDTASLNNNPLPLAGLIGQRTLSHGVSAASKNSSGLDIVRPLTTAPGRHDSPQNHLASNQQTGEKDFDRIVSPTPLRASHQNSPLLTSPTEKFKTPLRPSHYDDPFGASLNFSTGFLGFSNAHIPTDIHQRGPPVHQLPSPDSSDQSGASADHFQTNPAASFRTSTPHMRGSETEIIRAHRVFPQNNYSSRQQRSRHPVQQQVEVSMSRKRSREMYELDNRDQDQPGKRQKFVQQPQVRRDAERSVADSTPVDDVQHSSGSDVSSHQCVLDKLFSFKVEPFLQSRMEHFNDRVRFWQEASEEEWEEGLQELKERFDKMLQQTQDYMKRKQNMVATLEDRIKQHQGLLSDREKALMVAKENMLAASQNMLAR
ncbi:hypothetical protein AGABI2DRAFT_177081 [Agaricus bisporus var. bisporus H97]|uniref:hypothetical protein n=1 Tax=Agaricus bisporus var. bisporus (strain H97 / ATCC MYA-4626 / FGSC 10389) TaxID=936046 RepID=UPI00029F74F6|nr:hypothetical protein AGABI2DRAFT_177081 [Agaricus bisporus var. bisporus H97]EKV48868.1 hypothetical protein AGABI2DRAFT_177081 [Agaricus bisporus var. bisporus H97]